MRGVRAAPRASLGSIVASRSDSATPHDGPVLQAHHGRAMPDPFLVILAVIALACVVLFPVRIWRKRHHRYGNEADPDEDRL